MAHPASLHVFKVTLDTNEVWNFQGKLSVKGQMSRRWEFFTQYFVSMFRYFRIRWEIKIGNVMFGLGERERERGMMAHLDNQLC